MMKVGGIEVELTLTRFRCEDCDAWIPTNVAVGALDDIAARIASHQQVHQTLWADDVAREAV